MKILPLLTLTLTLLVVSASAQTRLTLQPDYDNSTASPVGVTPGTVVEINTNDTVFLIPLRRMEFYRELHRASLDTNGEISTLTGGLERGLELVTASVFELAELHEQSKDLTRNTDEISVLLDRMKTSIELNNELNTRQAQLYLQAEQNHKRELKTMQNKSIVKDFLKVMCGVVGTVSVVKILRM